MPLPLPTGMVTFLLTDIEGSTRLWEAHPEAMRLAVARHERLLRQAVEENQGSVFKTTGDGVAAAFAVATDALNASLAAQRALQTEAWLPETPIRVRMALHTGTAEQRDSDYYGTALNRTARLMAVGHGGQTLLSDVTQGMCRDSLPPQVCLLPLGEHRLKDLTRPEIIFGLQHPDLPAADSFPPLNSLDSPELPNNLPRQVTSFIGREKQMEEVKQLLGQTALLTLVGSGGTGKTRLSLQVAADVLTPEHFPDGVWLVELASLSDPTLVPQAVAQALRNVPEKPGQTMTQTLIDYLRPRCLLLVLDNCEHLVTACATLASDLLRACPRIKILATSREALNIRGEQTYRIPSLSLPDIRQTDTATPSSLNQYEAVRLFLDRAASVKPGFVINNTNAPAIAQTCFHLDGIPLAIELAAARVRLLSVEDINARLDSRFRLLTGGDRSALPRQQTLRALIDWSYDLLSGNEKTLLCRLAVFASGLRLPAAETVCAFPPLKDWEILDVLTSLVDKSLVLTEEEGPTAGGTRYRMQETVRQYGRERLAESGEASVVQERYRDWCVAFSEEAEPYLTGPEQGEWLNRLEEEHDNLRAVLAWYEQNGDQMRKAEAAAIPELRLAGALWRFWEIRGYLTEGREHLERALAGWQTRTGASVAAQRVAATAFRGAGNLAYAQGNIGAAWDCYEASLAIRRGIGDENGIALSLNDLANIAYRRGDFGTARARFEESLAIRREAREETGIAYALHGLGRITFDQGDFAAAQALQEESLVLFRKIGDRLGIAYSLHNLGRVAAFQGDFATTRALYEESLAIRRELGNKSGIAYSLINLGAIAAQQGDREAAKALYEESLAILRELGDKNGIAYSLYGLGNIAVLQNRVGAARALQEESLVLRRGLGDKNGLAYSLDGMASVFLSEGDARKAVLLWAAADTLHQSLGSLLLPTEKTVQQERLSQARAALGDEAFADAWNEGHALLWEQAIENALKTPL